jgi:hypothetical protein
MPRKRDDDETDQRLQKMLQGAFAGSPTPLKDIPTTEGKTRRLNRPKAQRRRAVRPKRKSAA